MKATRYLFRSLAWFWRTNLAAALGAATATAVLTGALVTGSSVRASLRALAIERLGAAERVLASRGTFTLDLARSFEPPVRSAPLFAIEGMAASDRTSARAGGVDIYGIDDSFFPFHGAAGVKAPRDREVLLSPALAAELGARAGDSILLRFEEPSVIPREFLHGRKDATSRTLRCRVAEAVTPAAAAEFSLRPRQGEIRAAFVSLDRLTRDLQLAGRANTVLLAGARGDVIVRRVREKFQLADLGLRVRELPRDAGYSLEHESTLLDDRTAEIALETARAAGILARPFHTWLANRISTLARSIPYSLVAGADDETLSEVMGDKPLPATGLPPIVLNDWAASDLNVRPGATIVLEYFVWAANGELRTEKSEFTLAGVAPMRGLAADRHIAPEYPGISDQDSLSGWDPPFPIDLKLVRPRDEEYWRAHRATPKAWIRLNTAREIWDTRFGSLTSIRFAGADPTPALRAALDPFASHLSLLPVREQALESSSGSADFGQYFLYFSFFVIVSALLLMGLFFRFGVEQRRGEIGLLAALGFEAREIRRLFLAESLVVGGAGAILGGPAGLGYAALVLHGLRTWWKGATQSSRIALHADWSAVAGGIGAGMAVSAFAVWLTLRRYEALAPRAAAPPPASGSPARRLLLASAALLVLGGGALAASASKLIPAEGGFFGAGFLLLLAFLAASLGWLRGASTPLSFHPGRRALFRLGMRNLAWRPGRAALCLALIASAAFIIVSLESFRHEPGGAGGGKDSGSGGYAIYAESLAPLVHDPQTAAGRDALNLPGAPALRWTGFRLRPGDDVSCLNLYEPRNPRILGVPHEFIRENRFRFASSTAASLETRENPWLLLEQQLSGGTIPAIIDQNSMQYVLHKRLGDDVVIEREGAAPLRFRLVAALQGSLFQSELLISEKSFRRLFPTLAGKRVFLIEGPASVIEPLEEALSDYGFDAQPAAARLASFLRVENTWLSTFQALGALGLLLGSLGLGAVLARNALERRRDLALLEAVGLPPAGLARLLVYENACLLAAGLAGGFLCALVAVSPAIAARGAALPLLRLAAIMAGVFLCGYAATRLGVAAALRGSRAAALRSE
jgi:ABC-type lipoprotein release transport system permease subunit